MVECTDSCQVILIEQPKKAWSICLGYLVDQLLVEQLLLQVVEQLLLQVVEQLLYQTWSISFFTRPGRSPASFFANLVDYQSFKNQVEWFLNPLIDQLLDKIPFWSISFSSFDRSANKDNRSKDNNSLNSSLGRSCLSLGTCSRYQIKNTGDRTNKKQHKNYVE